MILIFRHKCTNLCMYISYFFACVIYQFKLNLNFSLGSQMLHQVNLSVHHCEHMSIYVIIIRVVPILIILREIHYLLSYTRMGHTYIHIRENKVDETQKHHTKTAKTKSTFRCRQEGKYFMGFSQILSGCSHTKTMANILIKSQIKKTNTRRSFNSEQNNKDWQTGKWFLGS